MYKALRAVAILTALVVLGVYPGTAQEDNTQGDSECADGSHLFDHEYLATDPVCVPDDRQRVVALDMAALELLLYTDKEIVGSASWILDEYTAMLPQMAEHVSDIPDMGYPADLESVLEADPDVILAYSAQDDIIDYDLASDIAPVVLTSLAIDDWERTTQFWAEALGVESTFEEMLGTYDTRIAELQDELEIEPDETEMSLVTANTYGVNIWLRDSPQGKIVQDVGFARPESQDIAGEAAVDRYGTRQYAVISDEKLDLADGDLIYLFNYATTDEEVAEEEAQAVEEFRQRPLWQQLDAVQSDRVHVVGSHWYRAGTYLLAHKVIDDLFDTLTDAEPATPNPIDAFPRVNPETAPETTEEAS